ncbi:hypothetical protein BU23DRAFT_599493 [Bimuria novae-zelandiae CBS 107.79]|uniref:Rhodopsin domain-containing protein n=1 Tax=Bimuria novae-zelandiae CBS 107.79 TaxID=1447943 RepID=A0A6A5VCI4_9PLEO|nr:hypothetical protein BU23DRAFT_599493 [Bimuria novae-zelandiae CBS 107.79]
MSTNPAGLYLLCSVLPALATFAVGARFYVRNIKKQKFGVDDWTALGGLLGLWAVAGVILDGTRRGLFGVNSRMNPITGVLDRSWREGPNVEYSWIVPIVTVVALAPIKLSVIFLYRRVFHISCFFHYYSIGLCVLLVVWGLAFLFASIFQCGMRPWAYWTTVQTIKQYCDDTGGANVALCFSDLFIDVLILAAPLFMIWKMNFSTWRKVQIVGVFALGFLSTAAAATRVWIMWEDAYDTKRGHTNLLRENTKVVMWCLIEVSSALIACCLPVLRPMFSDTWVSRLLCKVRDSMLPTLPTKRASERELEEGMAFQSIGGTDFRVLAKRESMTRKDSKMSTNIETHEVDDKKENVRPFMRNDPFVKEIEVLKEVHVQVK